MALTAHQQEKFDEIVNLLHKGHTRIILKGSAGVGKTYLVAQLVKHFKSDRTLNPNYNNGHVFVTAPTNKALAVLMGKVDAAVDFSTIHSALKLKRHIDSKTGRVSFVKAFSREDNFRNAKIAVIDETSMLNTEIEGGYVIEPNTNEQVYMRGHLDDYNFPIIYIGDDKQINPVGEAFSPVFSKGYPEVELTEIIRQGNGNPIIELSRDIDMIFFKSPHLIDGKGYVYDNDKEGLIRDLAEVNGTDEMKFLAFTNLEIDSMNKAVREYRYGKPKKIEKHETIVFNSPFGEFYTNKEVKVLDVEVITDKMPVPKHNTRFDYTGLPINQTDFIKMKYYKINGQIQVVHEDSERVYKSIVDTLKYNCAKLGWNWKSKFYFEELFADIKYNHAITVHKSQGSTYKTSIINVGNILFNKNAEERQRLLYTAVTRASDLVILNNVK
jgi:ATP-dependent exoDNAse (exonuclease V) alpha subunit